MTPENKKRIKEIMDAHLKSKGWPNVKDPDRLVMDEAENMFRLLLKAELVKYADWEPYYMAAIQQYERAQLRKAGYDV